MHLQRKWSIWILGTEEGRLQYIDCTDSCPPPPKRLVPAAGCHIAPTTSNYTEQQHSSIAEMVNLDFGDFLKNNALLQDVE